MKIRNLICLITIFISFTNIIPTSAATVFDQGDETTSWIYTGGISTSSVKGQSFTTSQNNIIEVQVYFYTGTTNDLTVYISDTFDGSSIPADPIVQKTISAESETDIWYVFNFGSPVLLSPGTYWIVCLGTNMHMWKNTGTNTYPDGQMYGASGYDFGFRVYYDDTVVTEFGEPLFIVIGIMGTTIGLVAIQRRKK